MNCSPFIAGVVDADRKNGSCRVWLNRRSDCLHRSIDANCCPSRTGWIGQRNGVVFGAFQNPVGSCLNLNDQVTHWPSAVTGKRQCRSVPCHCTGLSATVVSHNRRSDRRIERRDIARGRINVGQQNIYRSDFTCLKRRVDRDCVISRTCFVDRSPARDRETRFIERSPNGVDRVLNLGRYRVVGCVDTDRDSCRRSRIGNRDRVVFDPFNNRVVGRQQVDQ